MEPNEITIIGAKEHNLKSINVTIPKKKLVVFTGVSGSGKSSLAFDILYAEGQRRYVESLSSYARQFLGQMAKPHYESIRGLSPAISIEQKSASKNPRSTVGTITEIHDYFRVLFANVGEYHCHQCLKPVSKQTPEQICEQIKRQFSGKVFIFSPLAENRKGEFKDVFEGLKADGFERIRVDKEIYDLSLDLPKLNKKKKHNIEVMISRLNLDKAKNSRLISDIEMALKYGHELIRVENIDGSQRQDFSSKFACNDCGISFKELLPQHFSFNSPLGMCPDCNGLGFKLEVDPTLIIPDENVSIIDGAIKYWNEATVMGEGYEGALLVAMFTKFGIDIHSPFNQLPKKHKDLLFFGTGRQKVRVNYVSRKEGNHWNFSAGYQGIIPQLRRRFRESKSEMRREWYKQFMSEKPCSSCNGARLNSLVSSVCIGSKSIIDLNRMTISDLSLFFKKLKLEGNKKIIASEVLKEIKSRLKFLLDVGLGYLSLERRAPTLSGGESQRIRLASQIGSELSGVMYILDEPSIGLHQRDNDRLINSLVHLKNLGNSVIVIEHDEDTIRSADHIMDFGPKAGTLGGEIVFSGHLNKIKNCKNSLTGQYLSGKKSIEIPDKRRLGNGGFIHLKGCKENNLKIKEVSFKTGIMTCVTGVSGAGKSSLINGILAPALQKKLNQTNIPQGLYDKIEIDENIDKVIIIDQNPIGRSSRSNPGTYTKVYDLIRELFAKLPESQLRAYKAGRFSFNVKGGRCEACEGAGEIVVEMHFLPDVHVECEECSGKRFNKSTLEIFFKGKNIADVLDMTILEAYEFFENHPRIRTILKTLVDVGMDYVKLGQPSTTLSGGEAQRIKLSRELCKRQTGNTVYILDEPTTGLHFEDIRKLLKVLDRLVEANNTVIVIEHNLDVIKMADELIDLGPEGGAGGGKVIAQGSPEEVAKKNKKSFTANYLNKILGK